MTILKLNIRSLKLVNSYISEGGEVILPARWLSTTRHLDISYNCETSISAEKFSNLESFKSRESNFIFFDSALSNFAPLIKKAHR